MSPSARRRCDEGMPWTTSSLTETHTVALTEGEPEVLTRK